MSNELVTALVSVLLGLVGLAALSVVLSPNARTSQVISAGSTGFSTLIRAAVSPVSGGGLSGGGFGFGGGVPSLG